MKQLREFTVELNPDDISEALVLLLKNYHVNRVSIGVQTFSPKLQHVIKRYITFDELATEAVRKLCPAAKMGSSLYVLENGRENLQEIVQVWLEENFPERKVDYDG